MTNDKKIETKKPFDGLNKAGLLNFVFLLASKLIKYVVGRWLKKKERAAIKLNDWRAHYAKRHNERVDRYMRGADDDDKLREKTGDGKS